MKPIVLFRKTLAEENEFDTCKQILPTIESRCDIPPDSLVIPRYSSLPYYEELELDASRLKSQLINTYAQHRYVADIKNWYYDLEDITPKTWFSVSEIPLNHRGSFVLKGETNSRKQLWKTHMFAETRRDIREVQNNLLDDSLIQHQEICVREFVSLKSYGKDIVGVPMSKEFRCFFYRDKLLAKGYYWSHFYDDIEGVKPDSDEIPDDFLREVAKRVNGQINFWVADVAQKEDGGWIVIELNCGSMSGLSMVNPKELYINLKNALDGRVG